jgi:enoyl-[acyl-carrier protein] reductase II
MGTRFVVAAESNVHENYKKKIITANDRSTVITGRALGHPIRSIKNKFTQEFQEMEENRTAIEELDKFGSGKLRAAVVDGDVDHGSVMSGQIAGLVNRIQPAAGMIEEIVSEAAALAKNIYGRFE